MIYELFFLFVHLLDIFLSFYRLQFGQFYLQVVEIILKKNKDHSRNIDLRLSKN